MIEENRTHDQDQDRHTTGTRQPEKGVKQNKFLRLWGDLHTINKKKFKKNLEIRKSRRIFVAVIKQQTHRKGKRKQQHKITKQ